MIRSASPLRITSLVMVLIIAVVFVSNAEDCPPCYNNQTPPNTTGNGSTNGRPNLNVMERPGP